VKKFAGLANSFLTGTQASKVLEIREEEEEAVSFKWS
jgi:hypothetical protein